MPTVKTILRNAIPQRRQVPLKYLYSRLRGDLEPELALLPLLVGRGDHAIDVGGNRGTYAYALWKLGARLDVFEPNPECAAILSAWAEGKPGMDIHGVALSSHAGRAQLHVPVDEHGVEHDASASIEPASGKTRDFDVPLQPLDSFGFDAAALIKIDVEGHETGVLQGATETLKSGRPALIVEIEQRHNQKPIGEIFAMIAGLGYRGFFLHAGRLNGIEEFDVARHQAMDAFASHSRDYCNNFLFLDQGKLAAGGYDELRRRWMPR